METISNRLVNLQTSAGECELTKNIGGTLWSLVTSHRDQMCRLSHVELTIAWEFKELYYLSLLDCFHLGTVFHRDCFGRDCFFWDCFFLGLFFSGTVFSGTVLVGTVFFWDCFFLGLFWSGLIWSGLLAEGLFSAGLFWCPAVKMFILQKLPILS